MSKVSFNEQQPLQHLSVVSDLKIFDVHVHVWDVKRLPVYVATAQEFGVKKALAITMEPRLKNEIEAQFPGFFEHAYYFSSRAFAHKKIEKLLRDFEEAQKNEYFVFKMWFGPRFLDFAQAEGSFRINDPLFTPLFSLLEENSYPVLIHIADPDIWFEKKYLNTKRYGTKLQHLEDFFSLLDRHPDLTVIGCHFGGYPENLAYIGEKFEQYSNYYVDTASTRWMIRELGSQRDMAQKFILQYKDRIIFGCDLSISAEVTKRYFATRYWAQRIFWETELTAKLPFKDEDFNGKLIFKGLKLPQRVLTSLYWKNIERVISKS